MQQPHAVGCLAYAVLLPLLQPPFTLKSLLDAIDVPPPYILVGHGMGGQLALQVRG
jgi:pimeloyl-ACP methyl ester carboxylesterase